MKINDIDIWLIRICLSKYFQNLTNSNGNKFIINNNINRALDRIKTNFIYFFTFN